MISLFVMPSCSLARPRPRPEPQSFRGGGAPGRVPLQSPRGGESYLRSKLLWYCLAVGWASLTPQAT